MHLTCGEADCRLVETDYATSQLWKSISPLYSIQRNRPILTDVEKNLLLRFFDGSRLSKLPNGDFLALVKLICLECADTSILISLLSIRFDRQLFDAISITLPRN